MASSAPATEPLPAALPPPFDQPPADAGLLPTAQTRDLVRDSVRDLLAEAPSFGALEEADQHVLEHNLIKVAAYAAECVRDDWLQSEQLGQRPVLVGPPDAGPAALAAADEFEAAAASEVAGVTRATLQAISFPEFVTDLVFGVFDSIINSSIKQMEAYTRLLADVAKTVDQFMAENITDNQARDWLAQRYPNHVRLAAGEPRLEAADGAEDVPEPGWNASLGLSDEVDPGDETAYEEILVPAARRQLAKSRLEMLSTLVMMGMDRIVVTGGKIRATMAFHVDTRDRAAQQRATDFDARTSGSASVGYGPWSASASMSVGYVRSNRNQSDAELNVAADLTGEVEVHFASAPFGLSRFLDGQGAAAIQANTAVPAANAPPWGDSAPMRAPVSAAPPLEPIRPIGQMPAAPDPEAGVVRPLIGPWAHAPDADGVAVTPAVEGLVAGQVRALLERSPAYYALDDEQRTAMQHDLTKIAAYSAALLQDGFGQAEKLGQTPVLRHQGLASPAAPARAAAVEQVAEVTRDVLDAIDFPVFVSDLLRGTFDAIVTSSIQQMEAYGELLSNVAKTVDQFMADNITDNQARDYLATRYPAHVVVDATGGAPVARAGSGADDLPRPDFLTDLGAEVEGQVDDEVVETVLVPAARRQLAQSRHQLLSTMVLMGINRIVVTSGRVRAKLDFHIDASDDSESRQASRYDRQRGFVAGAGWLGWGAATKSSVAYVKTAKQVSTDEINVDVDLTGELDLRFESETFPLEQFASSDVIGRIQAGTANPAAGSLA